jgi:hypothetical protein
LRGQVARSKETHERLQMENAQLREANKIVQMRYDLSQRQYESLNQSSFKQSLKLSYATRSILMAGVSIQFG